MVALTIKHSIQWQAPMPLWAENSSTGIRIHNEDLAPYPSILRFATDTFMQDMIDVMQENPKRIAEWVAKPETWREPMATPKPAAEKNNEAGLAFLLNKTKQLADAGKPAQQSQLFKPRQAVVIDDDARVDAAPIKLFQSSHQRFYLVSASLICTEPGYPDQSIDLSRREKASFVIRRLVPPAGQENIADNQTIDNIDDWDEYAFISTTSGHKWLRIDQSKSLACKKLIDREEQLALFPVNYRDSCCGRTLFSGLVPVGSREKWMAAPVADTVAGIEIDGSEAEFDSGVSHARIMFQTDVTEPWKILVEQAEFKKEGLSRSMSNFDTSGSSADETDRARRTHRDNIQMASWYVLLDFAKFLEQYLPALWSVASQLVANPALQAADFELDQNQVELLETIRDIELSDNVIEALVSLNDAYLTSSLSNDNQRRQAALNSGSVKHSLMDALLAVRPLESDLEAVENEFIRFDDSGSTPSAINADAKWPDFLFPLADPQFNGPIPDSVLSNEDLETRLGKIDALAELIEKILPEPSAVEETISAKSSLDQRDAWFVVRCVYERPRCGPLFPALVSEATRVFQMAPFFDPDAPTRPVRIPMPVDISPAGLRKYKKNTAFVISDMLCGKIKKIRKITLGDLVLSVLPWPFHKDLPNPGDTGPCESNGNSFGMICSLSIPIVTLCALILLMIMVALFDLFFRWIPFLFICLPIPGLKGKKT
ncbi:MAG: hypothetical protein GY794_20530 [bacterium]|nr:hypothetical protein [bacterium]